jgi:rod shape-determining protein MreC
MKPVSPRTWQIIYLVLTVAGILILSLSGYLGQVLKPGVSPLVGIQRWISVRYNAVYEFMTIPRDVAILQQRNKDLESEVSRLQSQVIDLQSRLREAEVLYALLDFARARPENRYVAAAVIGRDPSPFLHYLLIDHGSDDGLRHGMPVVTDQGLVGRIDAVTAGAARIQLISDPGFAVNVRIQPTQTNALITGSITGDINLEMVPQDVNLQAGDLVLTSGLGGDFPSDVIIGQVVTIRKIETSLFQGASVQPVVDFANLRAVLIIVNYATVNVEPLRPTQAP